MRRKYKPQRIGLNPKWFEIYIFRPLIKIGLIVAVITFAYFQYTAYSEKRAIEMEEQRLIDESIAAEERIKQEIKRAKEEARREEEARKESIAKIEVETRKNNTLYENKVSKKVCPIGTYLRNDNLNKVGRVVGYYGLEIITNNDWNFTIDGNGIIPDEVVIIGYAEYAKSLKKQKEQEEKKNRKENATKLQQLIDEEIQEQTKRTKQIFGNYTHFIFNNKKYRIIKIVGSDLIVLEKYKKDKKSNYETIHYSEDMEPIGYVTYETEKPK